MLLGEHSVVYGFPCLVTAVDTRIRVIAQRIDEATDQIITPQVKECKFVKKALGLFEKQYEIKTAIRIGTKGDFSYQVGLGSSSAVTVATFKALAELFGKNLSAKQIFDLSYQVTIDIQGVGSGFDIAAATYGGVLYYVYAGKTIDPIKSEPLPLIVGYSGIKADTPALIRKVKTIYQQQKDKTEVIFREITKIVEKGKEKLIKKDYKGLGFLMTKNHLLLQELGVSTPKLDRMVKACLNAGAYGSKLSGAGGGDCMIALSSFNTKKKIEREIEKAGGIVIPVKTGAEGVKIE